MWGYDQDWQSFIACARTIYHPGSRSCLVAAHSVTCTDSQWNRVPPAKVCVPGTVRRLVSRPKDNLDSTRVSYVHTTLLYLSREDRPLI